MTRLGILLAVAGLLTSCAKNRPIDTQEVCDAALQGYNDPQYTRHHQCYQNVGRAAFKAGHEAAKKYRDLPRS